MSARPGGHDCREALCSCRQPGHGWIRWHGKGGRISDVRFPGPAECLREEAASSPLAEHLSGLDPQTSGALIAELDSVLALFTDDVGVVFPVETCFVRAPRE